MDIKKSVLIPVPYGRTVTYRKGTENGPKAILDAMDSVEAFDEELNIERPCIEKISSLKVMVLEPEKMIDVVEKNVRDVLADGKLPVILGGEHTVSIGAVKAVRKRYKDMSILYFDAHYDLRDSYRGSRYNHACCARRLLDIAPVVEAGVRSLSKQEFDIVKLPMSNFKVISMLDIVRMPDWYKTLQRYLSDDVYITVDLDVFDPSIMPSVGTPEPGGMDWYGFLTGIRDVIRHKNIVGFDVVELCPIKDIIAPDFIAARLIYKIAGYIYAGSK